MKNSFFSVLGVLSLASAVVCSASPVWETDWNKALEKAGKSGQPVLVDFTGSDWCPGCIYLRKNIFDTDAFAKYAEDNNFVLVELDFPRTEGKMPPEQLKFHEELMRRYGISVFPSVLMMEGNGAPYAKIVGPSRTVEEYLKKLAAAGETRLKLKEAVAAARALEGKEKLEKLVQAIKLLPEDLQLYQKELIAEISALDPEDKYGFAGKAEKAVTLAAQRLMMEQFYKKHAGPFSAEKIRAGQEEALQMLEKRDLLPPIRLEIAKYVSDGYALERNYPKALEYLNMARDADPESPAAKKLEPWINNMQKIINKEK
ncbi:thioredoxin family protein [Akkermansia sp. Marseille-P9185]|uniref:thioredoxin family protein n=1 Tax=Akkermansia massiliensis TaxID=2927224 RepID=UPI00209C4C13|nr:thioredoxin family protein [Akkermansia massiliensis]MCO8186012.1 thioredoxin family protein [Akkermansia massiliensis]